MVATGQGPTDHVPGPILPEDLGLPRLGMIPAVETHEPAAAFGGARMVTFTAA